MPIDTRLSLPAPSASAIGTMPSTVVSVVIEKPEWYMWKDMAYEPDAHGAGASLRRRRGDGIQRSAPISGSRPSMRR